MKRIRNVKLLFAVVLGVITFALYWQTRNYGFLNYDDDHYVFENPAVTNGLTMSSLEWVVSKDSVTYTGHWHPVTILSLVIDGHLFGVHSGAMHLHSAAIHAVNAVLLFFFLILLLECLERQGSKSERDPFQVGRENVIPSLSYSRLIYVAAFIGAAFWAWHPLRVESVAWVSSRKDVLSFFWYLLGTIAYAKEVRQTKDRDAEGTLYMGLALLCFIIAFLAKPTAIVFLGTAFVVEYALTRRIVWRRLYVLGFLTFVFVLITLMVGITANIVSKNEIFGIGYRLANGMVAVWHYLTCAIYPSKLVCIYPLVVPVPALKILAGGGVLLCAWGWFLWRVRPILESDPPFAIRKLFGGGGKSNVDGIMEVRLLTAAGLLWFLGSLIPVSGFFGQVGCQAYADRYTYLPGVGLSIILTVLVMYFLRVLRDRRLAVGLILVLSLLGMIALGVATHRYLEKWKDSETLWSYVLEVSPDNNVARINRAAIYYEHKEYDKALPLLCQAAAKTGTTEDVDRVQSALWLMEKMGAYDNILLLDVKADDSLAGWKYMALGMIAEQQKLMMAAEGFYRKSVESDKNNYWPRMLLGLLLTRQDGRKQEALETLERALELNPEDGFLRHNVEAGKYHLRGGY
jgi:hypothetical protein